MWAWLSIPKRKVVDAYGKVPCRFVDHSQDESELNVSIAKGGQGLSALVVKPIYGKHLRVLVVRGDISFETFVDLNVVHCKDSRDEA